MNLRHCGILFIFNFLVMNGAFAAGADTQYWGTAFLRKEFKETPWWIGTELTYRYSETKDEPVVKSVRLWGGYKLASGTDLSLGFENRETDEWANNERRMMVQGVHRWAFESFALQARLRQEIRQYNDQKTDYQHRTRIQGRIEATAWTFYRMTPFLFSEWFYIHNDVGSRKAGSQETRNALGLSIAATDKIKVDVGYMDRRQTKPSGKGTTLESRYNVATVSATFKF